MIVGIFWHAQLGNQWSFVVFCSYALFVYVLTQRSRRKPVHLPHGNKRPVPLENDTYTNKLTYRPVHHDPTHPKPFLLIAPVSPSSSPTMLIRSKLSSLREYLTPINNDSNFSKTGEISPDEFVKAGDYLVYKFPTWQWGTCPDKLKKSFLPPDKQFLITKHVPSYQRVATYLGVDNKDAEAEEEDDDLGDEWVKSERINNQQVNRLKQQQAEQEVDHDIDELIDNNAEDDLEDEDEDDDEFQQIESDTNNQLRKYDLYITYSTSYRVPKLYLVGFNSNGIPLLPDQMFEDISNDYKDKTATIENLPVTYNTTSVSIHPCKHSSVMKVLMKHAVKKKQKEQEEEPNLKSLSLEEKHEDEEEEQGIRVDQYLIIFLKFIASVTPGIEYDYTMDAL